MAIAVQKNCIDKIYFRFIYANFSLTCRKFPRARRDDSLLPLDSFGFTASQNYTNAHIEGLRIEKATKPTYSEKGIPEILVGTTTVIRLFGTGITEDTLIAFTDMPAQRGTVCDKIKSKEFPVNIVTFQSAFWEKV